MLDAEQFPCPLSPVLVPRPLSLPPVPVLVLWFFLDNVHPWGHWIRKCANRSLPVGYLLATCSLLATLSMWVRPQKKCLGLEWGAHLPCMAAPGPHIHPLHHPPDTLFTPLCRHNHLFQLFLEKCSPPKAGSTFLHVNPQYLRSSRTYLDDTQDLCGRHPGPIWMTSRT